MKYMGQMNLQGRWPKVNGFLNKEDGHPQMNNYETIALRYQHLNE